MSKESPHSDPEWTPTESEVMRAWVMRQTTLDQEAEREPDPLTYSREFTRWISARDAEHAAHYMAEIDRLHRKITDLQRERPVQ